MESFIPSQKKQIVAWATLRDEKLREISNLDIEIETKTKKSSELGKSNQEIEKQISLSTGRLVELEIKEKERESLVSKEVVALESRKATLVSEVSTLEINKIALEEEAKNKVVLLETLKEIFDSLNTKVNLTSNTIAKVLESNQKYSVINKESFNEMKNSLDALIVVNKNNTEQTKIILDKLPRFIFELQKPIPIRRITVDSRPLNETKKKN